MNKQQLERIQTVNRRINWRMNIIKVPVHIGPVRFVRSGEPYPNQVTFKYDKKIRWQFMIPWRRSHISMERVLWYIEKKTGKKVYAIRLYNHEDPEFVVNGFGRSFVIYLHYYDIFLDETDQPAEVPLLEYTHHKMASRREY